MAQIVCISYTVNHGYTGVCVIVCICHWPSRHIIIYAILSRVPYFLERKFLTTSLKNYDEIFPTSISPFQHDNIFKFATFPSANMPM